MANLDEVVKKLSGSLNFPMAPTPLYGGALSLCIPPYLVDASTLRPIPDHQEVFVERADSKFNRSLIVELVALQPELSTENIGGFFFSDYASDSDAQSFMTTSECIRPVEVSGFDCTRVTTGGRMTAHSGESVTLLVSVLRIPKLASDIVVIFNAPGLADEELFGPHEQLIDSLRIHDPSLFI